MQGVNWGAEIVNSGIILVTFLVLMAFLNAVLFRPMLRYLDEREAKTHGAVDEAKALEEEAARALEAYEARLSAARSEAQVETAAARKRASDEEQAILERAREDAARRIGEIERDVAAATEQARSVLGAQAREMARAIAEKVLGRTVSTGLAVLAAAGLPATEAMAAAAGGQGGGFFATPIGGFVAHLVNFVILIGVLAYFAGPRVRAALEERRASYARAIEDAARLKADAEARAREYRERLARADAEIAALKAQYRADAEAERARILGEAERAAERIRRAAEQTAAQETAKARVLLREEAARLATSLAEQAIRRDLTPADQARLVQDFITRLPASAGDGRG
ncbi:MAG TPA: ATP synthase F0 subunit B [Thermodesulfobacteriota bacterium]